MVGADDKPAGPARESHPARLNQPDSVSEGAVHSHTRRGLADGLSPEELKHVALLAIPTLGLPQAVKGLTWIEDITDKDSATEA